MTKISQEIRDITAQLKISSQLIAGSDFNLKKLLDDPKTNREMYDEYAGSSKNTQIKSFGENAELIERGQKILLLDHKNKNIEYYVQYEFSSVKKFKAITQIAIWAADASPYTKIGDEPSVMKDTFFNRLLPKADCIVADSLQTDDGMRFWLRRLTDALGKGLYVYVYSRSENKVYRADDIGDIRKTAHTIWGKSDSFFYKRALISQKELFPDAEPLLNVLD